MCIDRGRDKRSARAEISLGESSARASDISLRVLRARERIMRCVADLWLREVVYICLFFLRLSFGL